MAAIRADAHRNRERLLACATAAFAAGTSVSLEAIAREAGVGIGTLYRHFPSREALVEAVYGTELAEVAASAEAPKLGWGTSVPRPSRPPPRPRSCATPCGG